MASVFPSVEHQRSVDYSPIELGVWPDFRSDLLLADFLIEGSLHDGEHRPFRW